LLILALKGIFTNCLADILESRERLPLRMQYLANRTPERPCPERTFNKIAFVLLSNGGRGADIIILDDILKPDDALSEDEKSASRTSAFPF
jgi:hypothetical protein